MSKQQQPYFVYIVASKTGRLCIGVTKDIFRRTLQHKQSEIAGFSKQYKCNRLVYYVVFQYVRSAIAREKQLKGWSRKKKVALIESKNPRWEDLAENCGSCLILESESLEKYR